MPEPDAATLVILLASCLGLLALILAMLGRFSSRLQRIEALLVQVNSRVESVETAQTEAVAHAGGAFETFLEEDPARRKLTKSEQFSAYRKWRHDNGMNWSNS